MLPKAEEVTGEDNVKDEGEGEGEGDEGNPERGEPMPKEELIEGDGLLLLDDGLFSESRKRRPCPLVGDGLGVVEIADSFEILRDAVDPVAMLDKDCLLGDMRWASSSSPAAAYSCCSCSRRMRSSSKTETVDGKEVE